MLAWGIAASLLAACGVSAKKLDEVVFYDGPSFRLKLTRYYENYPLHYTGKVFRVQCSSAETAESPAHRTQDAGWVTLGNGGAIGSRSAAELLRRERGKYLVINERTLAWTSPGFNVSFDACARSHAWYPTSVPRDLVDTVAKPSYCKPTGVADCQSYDFLNEREPRFDEIRVEGHGAVSFVARSAAFRPNGAVRVESSDSGRTWSATPL